MFTAITDPTRPVSAIATAAIGGTARRVLHRIRDTEIDLALWERTLPAEAADFCAKLAFRSSALDLDITGASGSMLLLLATTALFTRASDYAPASLKSRTTGAAPSMPMACHSACLHLRG